MSITPLACIRGTHWQFAVVPALPICFTWIDGALTALSARQQTPQAVTKRISLITKSSFKYDSIIEPVSLFFCGLFSIWNVCWLCNDGMPRDNIRKPGYLSLNDSGSFQIFAICHRGVKVVQPSCGHTEKNKWLWIIELIHWHENGTH